MRLIPGHADDLPERRRELAVDDVPVASHARGALRHPCLPRRPGAPAEGARGADGRQVRESRRQPARGWRRPGRGDGCGEGRRAGAIVDRAWRRTARGRGGEGLYAEHECRARGSRPAPSGAVLRPSRAADRRSAGGARGARARGRGGRLQGDRHQRPSSRPLSRRPFLLAGARAGRGAQAADLSPSDPIAPAGDRRLVRRPSADGRRDDGERGMGLAHRDGASRAQDDFRRRLRRASGAADRRRAHGGDAAGHARPSST